MKASKYTIDLFFIAISLVVLLMLASKCNTGHPEPQTIYIKGKPDTIVTKGDTVRIKTDHPIPYIVYVDSSSDSPLDSIRLYKNNLSGSFGELNVISKVRGTMIDQKVDFIPNITTIRVTDTIITNICNSNSKPKIGVMIIPTISTSNKVDLKVGPTVTLGGTSIVGMYGVKNKEFGIGLIYNF